jgi:predicted Zn-dependent peptidase
MKPIHLLKTLLAAAVIAVGFNSFAIEFNSGSLKIAQFKLDNGLTVILNEDHSKPEVFGVVAVRAGGKNDPADATGLAHYMEHMLFKGTQSLGTIDWEKEKPHIDRIFELYDELATAKTEADRNAIQLEINKESHKASEFAIPNELSNLINEMGGTSLNAGTGPDYTVYYNKFPSSQIYKWIDLYSHRFIDPVFRSFQAELEVVYEEKNMYSDQFQSKLLEDFQKLFFKAHPYGQQPLIGTIEHLKNPSLRRMLEFYNKYYVANNMVLVLSGDFVTSEIMADIEAKFGKIPAGDDPTPVVFNERPFNGREFHEARISPIKLGILGFRTVTKQHPDYIALEVAMGILNNRNQTGLLDRLSVDGKILAAQALSLPYNDHGAAIILMIPKVVGQKLPAAETMVLNEISRLAKGDFDDWMVDAVKSSIYIEFQKSLENLENRATFIAGAFTSGESIEDALAYPQKVMAISKDDIIRVAKTYFGPNFLAFHSKMGFPKKEKMEKPGFEPLLANTNAKSKYTKHFETLPSRETVFTPIDFEKDITRRPIANGVELLQVHNPLNDIFTLNIQYNVGNQHIKLLDQAVELMSYAGTEKRGVAELKNEFAKIGCSYSIWSNNSYTTIIVEGLEENLPKAVELTNELITKPKLEQDKIKVMVDGTKADRKMERSEPDAVAQALFDFIRFADKSSSLDRPTMKELKKLKADNLTNAFKLATKHTAQIHYVGNIDTDMVQTLFKSGFEFAEQPISVSTPVVIPSRIFSENTIFFVNKKKARQSKIFFFANGADFKPKDAPYIEAFNEYFGGGFSGLVLQEIREYRSLAYGAGGTFRLPPVKGKPVDFIGSLSTQADKSIIALTIYDSLIRTMPQKPERIDMIRNYLTLSAETKRPSFRNTTLSVEYWKRLGYSIDPVVIKQPVYQLLTWNDIMTHYRNNLSEKPVAIAIVGDKRMIDFESLKKFGRIVEVKEKDLFSK